ncbi:bifunctional diaminohydroxyphosphoribosylaminopyrimidine deaminase/5-amino-6-(5-phosphoribosylamino)uracil reductase RibD [Shewanella sp. Isolate11]|uniref:bifunctional diaminohydroxyphosphoribosylaminopyrimidine deaminase/5-amino-6-(5-phosphoribosylamino)uracil reductase RibD n=1 Tax=Shewanella sp. Isolate11 TaxID=2908530 RepID=UPI001EFCEF79|nr:bifunctional diaminohydroxyphosphoribosylaminopyrimidine deaminase/5-amino-6-(5-phosphoribosylamino)uracil reductase RibD [Shewanella sp. Isolate11]MCG9697299.1 bifunctional diaminohydroxyphosphoribosylaminopyrimidine deaminase/5-amino-6-(5-phosphoribosylamino)uracil reductase RibD [Shewanella sp. Isolate11]
MPWSTFDLEMMARAIKLARKGQYTTQPNPSVGCVITQEDKIVGEGYHIAAGGPHAEVHALKMAGEQAIGATAYVTLEPCSHYGRTPPCAEALIKAKVARVVVAVTDPNPQVSGRGIEMLQQQGIKVEVGLHQAEAAALNPGFMKRMATGLPWVSVKLAASLDGKTALSNGVSKWITGPEARQDVQRMRARHCAVITGIETVLADDPSLNVRPQELGSLTESIDLQLIKQPLRVVLDSRARLGGDAKLFTKDAPILLVSTQPYSQVVQAGWPEQVSHLQLPAVDGRVPLNELLKHLGQSCNSVMIEAGATLAGAFISAQLVDELVLYQAPKLLGSHGRNLVELADYQQMQDLPHLVLTDERKVGVDRRYRFTFTDPNK